MDLAELSSQRPTVQSNPILVDAYGNPCKISVQAVELEGRPRLVRALKNSGALVVGNVKDAEIILVDSSTEIGRRLIRTWGTSPSKVVLQQAWARLSIEAGYPLLQMDDWGGMRAIDDGLPVMIDGIAVDEEREIENLVSQSPLPTPRITPDDSSTQKREETDSSMMLPANVTGPMTVTTHSPSIATSTGLHATPTYPFSNQYQSAQPSLFAQPGPTAPFIPPHLQSHFSQSSLSNTTFNVPSTSSFASFPQNFAAPSPEAFSMLMTMFEIMRHKESQSQPTWSDPSAPASQPHSDMQQPILTQPYVYTSEPLLNDSHTSLPAHQSQEVTKHVGPGGSQVTPHPRNGVGNCYPSQDVTDTRPLSFANKPRHHFAARQSSNEVLSSSISRKRPPAVKPTRPPKRANKGKGKDPSPSDSSEAESHSDSQLDMVDSPLHNSYSASPPEPARIIVGRRNPGEIFITEEGQSLHFFVQVDLHKRVNVVSNIKKNKGKIVNNIPDADYVIASSRTKSYDWLLREATALEKIPIQGAFVIDCIDECALLDEIGYALEADSKTNPTRRRRPAVERQNNKPKPVALSREVSRANTKGLSKVLTPKIRKQKSGYTPHVASSPKISAPPSPPPPEARKRMSDGRYYFTEGEDEYLCQFAQHHFTQDPSMSITMLMHKLHEKMPHHSVASWQGNADRKFRSKLETIRKKASITKRKNAAEPNPVGATYDDRHEPGPSMIFPVNTSSKTLDLDGEQPPKSHNAQEEEEEDFDIICQFFASGGGDDDDDERVWQELAKFKPCRTAGSWPEYYAAHQQAVYAHIEELMTGRARGEAS